MKNESFTVLGNAETKKYFSGAISAGKLAHAYIFEGMQGSGKKTLVRRICMQMACDKREEVPCGSCENCLGISGGISPDIRMLTVENGKKTIGVDEVRDFFASVSLTPSVLDFKAYIIDMADTLTLQAQNALLKIIEEPPFHTYIFLLCENSEKLLPTVRSRAQKIIMQAFDSSQIEEYIRESGIIYDEEALYFAVHNASGSIGKAIGLLTEKTLDREAYDIAHCIISAQSTKNEETSYFSFLKIFNDRINSRELVLHVCACLSRAYADIIAYSVKNSNDMEFFTLDEMNRISCNIGVDSAIKCSEAVMKTTLLQQSNVNINLSLTVLASTLWNNV